MSLLLELSGSSDRAIYASLPEEHIWANITQDLDVADLKSLALVGKQFTPLAYTRLFPLRIMISSAGHAPRFKKIRNFARRQRLESYTELKYMVFEESRTPALWDMPLEQTVFPEIGKTCWMFFCESPRLRIVKVIRHGEPFMTITKNTSPLKPGVKDFDIAIIKTSAIDPVPKAKGFEKPHEAPYGKVMANLAAAICFAHPRNVTVRYEITLQVRVQDAQAVNRAVNGLKKMQARGARFAGIELVHLFRGDRRMKWSHLEPLWSLHLAKTWRFEREELPIITVEDLKAMLHSFADTLSHVETPPFAPKDSLKVCQLIRDMCPSARSVHLRPQPYPRKPASGTLASITAAPAPYYSDPNSKLRRLIIEDHWLRDGNRTTTHQIAKNIAATLGNDNTVYEHFSGPPGEVRYLPLFHWDGFIKQLRALDDYVQHRAGEQDLETLQLDYNDPLALQKVLIRNDGTLVPSGNVGMVSDWQRMVVFAKKELERAHSYHEHTKYNVLFNIHRFTQAMLDVGEATDDWDMDPKDMPEAYKTEQRQEQWEMIEKCYQDQVNGRMESEQECQRLEADLAKVRGFLRGYATSKTAEIRRLTQELEELRARLA